MSALNKMIKAIEEKFPLLAHCSDEDQTTASTLFEFITEYAEEDRKQWEKNKADGKLTFGKWKGFSIDELVASPKGSDYLSWLLTQSWCTEDKYGYIYEGCKRHNISKKKARAF